MWPGIMENRAEMAPFSSLGPALLLGTASLGPCSTGTGSLVSGWSSFTKGFLSHGHEGRGLRGVLGGGGVQLLAAWGLHSAVSCPGRCLAQLLSHCSLPVSHPGQPPEPTCLSGALGPLADLWWDLFHTGNAFRDVD